MPRSDIDRIREKSGKPIELSVEANGKKLTVKAHSREELEAAIRAAGIRLIDLYPISSRGD